MNVPSQRVKQPGRAIEKITMHSREWEQPPFHYTPGEEPPILQQPLFPDIHTSPPSTAPEPLVNAQPVTSQTTLASCALAYQQAMIAQGISGTTAAGFLSDLKLLSAFLGRDIPVSGITADQLADWIAKMRFGTPGAVPAPNTIARRITFLKHFFAWLAQQGIRKDNPAAALVSGHVLSPLPHILFDNEVERLFIAAAGDPLSHCLVYLMLHTGLKKGELLGLRIEHIDLSRPQQPTITVRAQQPPEKRYKSRTLTLPPEFTTIAKRYLQSYHPTRTWFPCTDHQLHATLTRLADAAGIKKRITIQILRDTFAVQQLRSGVSPGKLKTVLGLSEEAWTDTLDKKYRRLAFPKGT